MWKYQSAVARAGGGGGGGGGGGKALMLKSRSAGGDMYACMHMMKCSVLSCMLCSDMVGPVNNCIVEATS